MKIVIAGGSGQIGTMLARRFHAKGDAVVVLGRSPAAAPWRTVRWDAVSDGPWSAEIDGADVLINLAGRSVNCRYGAKNRRLIVDSRVNSVRALGRAVAKAAKPPRVWLQAGTATLYAHRYDAPNDEATGLVGHDDDGTPDTWRFSTRVAKAWEKAFEESLPAGTRGVILRAAITMTPDKDGVFDVLVGLARKGLGGWNGDGRQFVSWIHEHDFIRATEFLIARDDIAGPVNLAAPAPLPNAEFMKALREALGVRIGLPATRAMLEVGAFFMRTETELVLKSRRVVPGRLTDAGFVFDFPQWPEAAHELAARHRQG